MIFDETQCELGEGALWHPKRQALIWFDINAMRMFERGLDDVQARVWQFEEHVSAAAWINENRILIASETSLSIFDYLEGESQYLCGLESENTMTRSNDGRADPQGGFWIGTMGKQAEEGAGAIYRYYDGAIHKLFDKITIPNAISFSPDGKTAYFTDTPTQKIMRVALDAEGWPLGDPALFADVTPFNPDGAVVDADGNLWNAQWGSSRVVCYAPDGQFIREVKFEASQISCPAFGGTDFTTLFATSARENMTAPTSFDGQLFSHNVGIKGQEEHRVRIS